MSFTRYLRAAHIFAKYQAWVDAPEWTKGDEAALLQFLTSPAGAKLSLILKNLVLRQQASALSKTSDLQYEAGFATGQKAAVAAIESLLPQISADGDTDSDHALTQEESHTG